MRFDAKAKSLKQVRLKSGGGIRVLDVTGGECVVEIKNIALNIFFPEGNGSKSNFQLGSFKGEPKKAFVNPAGSPVTYGICGLMGCIQVSIICTSLNVLKITPIYLIMHIQCIWFQTSVIPKRIPTPHYSALL